MILASFIWNTSPPLSHLTGHMADGSFFSVLSTRDMVLSAPSPPDDERLSRRGRSADKAHVYKPGDQRLLHHYTISLEPTQRWKERIISTGLSLALHTYAETCMCPHSHITVIKYFNLKSFSFRSLSSSRWCANLFVFVSSFSWIIQPHNHLPLLGALSIQIFDFCVCDCLAGPRGLLFFNHLFRCWHYVNSITLPLSSPAAFLCQLHLETFRFGVLWILLSGWLGLISLFSILQYLFWSSCRFYFLLFFIFHWFKCVCYNVL